MRKTVACSAPYGSGGLGQHFSFIVEEARSQNTLAEYYTPRPKLDDSLGRNVQVSQRKQLLMQYSPLRYDLGWLTYFANDWFDRAVAAVLSPGDELNIVGAGQALHSFQRARELEYRILSLQADTSHINHVAIQNLKAIRAFGIEPSWLNNALRRKTLQAYEMADLIYVTSDYSYQSFIRAGIPESKLRTVSLPVHSRFTPASTHNKDGVFRVLYCGSLTVTKGIPVLLEAFSRLPGRNSELILVGGSTTHGMRKYLEAWKQRDSRIRIAPGDPLPHLQRASVYVHPSYQDGFAYAPMEALACGVPVVVTEDTGMKTFVQEGRNGYVVPTGDWEAILDRLKLYQSLHQSVATL
ncbi:glycosyltransferase family 4 protein [Leptolyngbya sp. NIES-2104]|uniref:glycosyltransferase family 4 protein n=1 Tax=Leptolyngbya sp. NIES-2104 TaxID=1552121 RepID=UPI0006EC823D|nr:glycosyltransferase family 4 protein [Leptolyngbya sp. NIES-2104]GAP95134.1 glycosyl transferase group 1 [Leptolyngbya sp. NIES-2104]